jgi:hypothetical protein
MVFIPGEGRARSGLPVASLQRRIRRIRRRILRQKLQNLLDLLLTLRRNKLVRFTVETFQLVEESSLRCHPPWVGSQLEWKWSAV